MKKFTHFALLVLFLAGCTSANPVVQAIQPAGSAVSAAGQAQATTTLQAQTSSHPATTGNALPVAADGAQGKIPNFEHIILIVLENRDYSSVIGSNSTNMPLLNTLASQNVLLTNYFAITHPSLPNYIALMSGGTQNITSDCNDCFVNKPNLADEIEASGRTWKAYMDGMPSACFTGDSGSYVQRHNPLLYYDSIRLDTARCNRSILPLPSLEGDLANNQLPNFAYIIPDLCNSGHDCSAVVADKWVNDMVAKLQASPALGNNSLIIIAFDEGNSKDTAGCCGLASPAGGHIAVVLISPTALPDISDNTPYTHYSLLKTILAAWKLPALGATALASTQVISEPWTGLSSQSN